MFRRSITPWRTTSVGVGWCVMGLFMEAFSVPNLEPCGIVAGLPALAVGALAIVRGVQLRRAGFGWDDSVPPATFWDED
ncbi:hypothetical protein [Actinocatenispora rupis]|uniref:Uncharacterized protein n=1 Tax=Actinocatenispora rupis TaxID=519421 RepID=A0A8J3J0V4_9ACTN|nr:hypothetical protein [Actinocatenispora rupis]GID09985.1 hypothetical protein Aru02nite_08740 [Actinocatenispora rupis]